MYIKATAEIQNCTTGLYYEYEVHVVGYVSTQYGQIKAIVLKEGELFQVDLDAISQARIE